MADVNSKPTDPRCAIRAALAETDLRLEIRSHEWVEFIGTKKQLEAEGVANLDGRWPTGYGAYSWEEGGLHFAIRPEFKSNLRKLYGDVPEQAVYRLRVRLESLSAEGLTRARLLEKLDEMEEIKRIGSTEHRETVSRCAAAQSDKWFQARLSDLVACALPRRGGRPRGVGA